MKQNMKKYLDKSKMIVLYGAGQKSHSIYNALRLSQYTIAYCVVTSDCIEESIFEDIKVYPFSLKRNEIIEQGYQVVIACSQKYEGEIVKILEERELYQYWKTDEMPWNRNFKEYSKLDIKECISIIKKKYFSDTAKYQRDELVRKYMENNERQEIDETKIVFLLTCASPRAYKIIDALHRSGYIVEVYIWFNAMYLTKERYEEFERISDRCELCTDVEEVMLYCAVTNAKILHIFSDANSDILLPHILIQCKSIFPKIVFDEYDVMVGLRRNIPQSVVDSELFCLQYADGLCNRNTCMAYLESKGYEICKQRIHFIDCCLDDDVCASRQKSETDALQLVFVGTLLSDNEYKNSTCDRYLELGLLCENNKVHLHLYPVFYDEGKLYEYIEMEKTNPYFHLHHPVPVYMLAEELCQYDYGISSTMKAFFEENADNEASWTKESLTYSSVNKLYDFLDAGLPIIAVTPVEQTKMLEEDGVLIRKCDEEIDFDELRKRRDEMKKRVLEVRKKYMVSNQLPRLIEFYNRL